MWDAWLGLETTDQDRDEETIESGDSRHSADHFKSKLTEGIGEMFKVLKYDHWLSLVFAHREPAMWDTIVKSGRIMWLRIRQHRGQAVKCNLVNA